MAPIAKVAILAWLASAGLAAFGVLHDAPSGLYWVAAFLAMGGCVAVIA